MNYVSLARHGDVAVVTVDNPPVNALSRAVRAGLMQAVDEAEADSTVRAIVLICAGRTFIAGADIREFERPPEEPHLPDVVERIEASSKPVLAAMHGTALGGGLEIAMGCHYRLAAPEARVGLPEVKLGLLPGATGTQRLPRLVGAERALELMLSGEPIGAARALEAGLVDRVTSGESLLAEALAYAAELREPRRVRDLPAPVADREVFARARQQLAKSAKGLFSPEKIVRAVELAGELDYDAGVLAERELFNECKASPQSSGLRHAFFAEREAAKVPGLAKDTPTREMRRIAVLGAGTMGTGIAYACLSAGFPVRLLDNDAAGLTRGEDAIRGLFEAGIARGKLEAADMVEGLRRLKVTQDYEHVADADLV
ncbi:MAG TPA: enoyl-CoA hydratase-related protein, partial [Woeseiaceae bacterium]